MPTSDNGSGPHFVTFVCFCSKSLYRIPKLILGGSLVRLFWFLVQDPCRLVRQVNEVKRLPRNPSSISSISSLRRLRRRSEEMEGVWEGRSSSSLPTSRSCQTSWQGPRIDKTVELDESRVSNGNSVRQQAVEQHCQHQRGDQSAAPHRHGHALVKDGTLLVLRCWLFVVHARRISRIDPSPGEFRQFRQFASKSTAQACRQPPQSRQLATGHRWIRAACRTPWAIWLPRGDVRQAAANNLPEFGRSHG